MTVNKPFITVDCCNSCNGQFNGSDEKKANKMTEHEKTHRTKFLRDKSCGKTVKTSTTVCRCCNQSCSEKKKKGVPTFKKHYSEQCGSFFTKLALVAVSKVRNEMIQFFYNKCTSNIANVFFFFQFGQEGTREQFESYKDDIKSNCRSDDYFKFIFDKLQKEG